MRQKYITLLFMGLATLLGFGSCDPVFPHKELDHFWKLDKIEYLDGMNLFDNPMESEDMSGAFWGFQAHMVQVESHKYGFSYYGITDYSDNTLKMDFTRYISVGGRNLNDVQNDLRHCGIDSVVTQFKVTYPDRKSMVLTGTKTKLHFRMW